MYKKILFPTDGSEGASAALNHAVHLAELHDSELHVLFVVDTTHIGLSGTTDEITNQGEEVVERVVKSISEHDFDITKSVLQGIPYKEITDYATSNDIDLVVMGTHGRSGLDRYTAGSVTEKVVRHSDVPVFTARLAGQ